jgi:phosphatidyl-myo-inositol dimannoside synthase
MNTRPRGLLVTADYPPQSGGIARLLFELTRNSEDTVEWRILTTAAGPLTPGVVRAPIGGLVGSLPRHALWLKGAEQRFVACGHVKVLPLALAIGRLGNTPVGALVYGRELLPRTTRHRLGLQMLRGCNRVVAISAHTGEITHRIGVGRDRIRIVHPVFRPPWSGNEPRSRRPGEGLRAIAVTRLAEGYKNLEVLLRLVKVLSGTGAIEQLTIVGGGRRLAALQAKADRLGVANLVHFTGPVDDKALAELIQEAHIGLFPSRSSITEGGFEGFGLVVQELASAGLPVVVGATAGALDAASPEWSLLVDPDNLREWVKAVEWLADNEADRMRMAKAAMVWAEQIDPVATARRFVDGLVS